MDVNNKLYGVYFNQKPLMQQPKKEENKAEELEAPLIKAPEAKPVTASVANIVAEMNKSLIVNPVAKGAGVEEKVAESGDEQFIKYCELMQRLNSLNPESQEYRETVEALLALAEAFAQNNPTSVDADWVAAIDHWRGILDGLGRGDKSGPDRAGEEEYDYVSCTLEDLRAENNEIWGYVKDLLTEYHIDFVDNFMNIGDGSSNPANIPIMEPLAMLRQELLATPEGIVILQKLNERVQRYLENLSAYHQYSDPKDAEITKNTLKHPMHFGIWVTLCGN